MAIKHSKHTTRPDSSDPDKVQPSDWNADHVIEDESIPLSAFVPLPGMTLLGVPGADPAAPESLTGEQVVALLPEASTLAPGLAPMLPGNTTVFLRGDGTWAAPAGGEGGGSGFVYDVTLWGLVANSAAAADANRAALQALVDFIKASGRGGYVYFPSGKWWIGTKSGPLEDDAGSIMIFGHQAGLTFGGDGPSSKLLWTGNLNSTAKYLFWMRGGGTANPAAPITTKNILFENLYIAGVNQTNLFEHNHLIRAHCQYRGDVENVTIKNCTFGWTNGDCVFLSGSVVAELSPGVPVPGGLPHKTRNVKVIDCTMNGFDKSEWTVTAPTSGYRACVAHQAGVEDVIIANCYMTGSDDSLVDYEPSGDTHGVRRCILTGCLLKASSPSFVATGTPAASFYTVAYGGENEAEGIMLEQCIMANNVLLNGRIHAHKVAKISIVNNQIETDSQVNPEAAIQIQGTAQDILIQGNRLRISDNCGATAGVLVTAIDEVLDARRERVMILDNEISQPNGNPAVVAGVRHGISVLSCDAIISRNRVEHRGTDTNKSNAIEWKPTTTSASAVIQGNLIVGDAGGGSWQYAISVQPADPTSDGSAVAVKACTIVGNVGTGCATGGVRCAAPTNNGAYTTWPVVVGNSLPYGTSGAIVLGAGVYAIIGGNRDGITQTIGGATSPLGAVIAWQGSTHVQMNGNSTAIWRKTSNAVAVVADSTGWVTP